MAGDKAVAWCRGLQAVLESLGLLVGEVLLPAVRVVAVGEELARLVTSFLTRLAGVEEVLSLLPSDLTKYNVAKCTTTSNCAPTSSTKSVHRWWRGTSWKFKRRF